MKINIYGIIIIIFLILNIIYMMFYFFSLDWGPANNVYILAGTAISLFLIIMIWKNHLIGYMGTVLFFGVQIFGTDLIFDNFRYGMILRWEQSLNINNSVLFLDINLTAVLLLIMGIIGLYRFKKTNELL